MSLQTLPQTPRFGLKGPASAGWLEAQGVTLPQQPNAWLALAGDDRVLRLGRGEYLLEGAIAQRMEAAWPSQVPGLYRVPRYDAAFVLGGDGVPALLAEICALDTRPEVMEDKVLLTLAAGISVTLVCEAGKDNHPQYRLWCDATYGDYMQHVLNEIID